MIHCRQLLSKGIFYIVNTLAFQSKLTIVLLFVIIYYLSVELTQLPLPVFYVY